MRYNLVLAPEAVDDLRQLKARQRAKAQAAIEAHLRHTPTVTSKSRIKRLRGLSRPQYQLRVDDLRVYFDVLGNTVEVLAVLPKGEAQDWLARVGEPNEDSGTE
jgi:mRNA-degrading endonuclease RelE of RelBE toxin-antitoxin system